MASTNTYRRQYHTVSGVWCLRLLPLCLALVLLQGCGGAAGNLSNEELAQKIQECRQTNSPSAAGTFACDNYRRECSRRREAGNYVC